MSLLNRFFKSKEKIAPAEADTGVVTAVSEEPVSLKDLQRLIPIRQLKPEFLETFALSGKARIFPAGTTLFTAGESSDCVYFLLRGKIELVDQRDRSYMIDVSDPKACFALSAGDVYTTTAVAKTEVSILAVSQKIMQMNQVEQNPQLEVPTKYENNRLLNLFVQYFSTDEIDIPSMPDTALKLHQAMEKDIGVYEVVEIIQLDPVVSGKLIQVANCPLYLAAQPAKSCLEAVNRIGLLGVRSLVTSICLKHIFHSDKPLLKNYMDELWRHSVYISCLCFFLAKESKKIDPEEALLAGLIVNIGAIPFLEFVDNLPEDFYTKAELKEALEFVRGAAGRSILEKWDFPEALLDIPYYANDWYQHQSDELSLLDLVVLAELHSRIGNKDKKSYPVISTIPAASKLKNTNFSPMYSLTILYDAKEKINDALRIFL